MTVEFIKNLRTGEVEISNLKTCFKLKDALLRTNENIYFLTGIKKGITTRASDRDIATKKYFAIDIDLMNNYEETYNEELKDSISDIGIDMIKNLKIDNNILKNWRYVVFSGRGLHFYYTFKEQKFNIKEYSLGVRQIYKQWDEYWGDNTYNADAACSNIARVMRLPGTINQKNGKKCIIIANQDKDLDIDIAELGKEEIKKIKIKTEKRQKEIEEKLKSNSYKNDDLYEKINSIPAYDIAQMLIPEFKYNGNNNFKNNKGGFTGYFYNKTTNTICNGGSRYFNNGDSGSCYNNFILVKNFKNWDNIQVFSFFKELIGG